MIDVVETLLLDNRRRMVEFDISSFIYFRRVRLFCPQDRLGLWSPPFQAGPGFQGLHSVLVRALSLMSLQLLPLFFSQSKIISLNFPSTKFRVFHQSLLRIYQDCHQEIQAILFSSR